MVICLKSKKSEQMKNIKFMYIVFSAFMLLFSCEEIGREPITKDSEPPRPVSGVQVENLPGGALITYTLPDDTDLLYVKAEYVLSDGRTVETKSSVYTNSVKAEGFGDTQEREVKLYAVDRSENMSTPVSVKIQPLEPPVHTVRQTVEVKPAFGGVQYSWVNNINAPLAFVILAQDENGGLYVVETVYSSVTNGTFTVRGFEPEEKIFGVVVRDRWDNLSDTIKITATPMFEMRLDKTKFEQYDLSGDADMNAWEGRFHFAYDDNPSTFNHTWAGTGWPQFFTIDLGVTAQLSRVNILQRQTFFYAHGNPRLLEIWGMADTPPADGSWGAWTKLRDCVAIRPSQQGGTAEEDQAHFAAGDEYAFTLEDPPVRYVRILVNETWGLTGFIHFAEITFWGQVIE
jgi:hypothetical protein